ncbi:MAG: PAS domain-containing protein [Chitinivibrionales bacterium]|nr:PAS domain-containing protein [Chitinivibrionales bacterium]MBD3356318.1 PAS domain-containing protein [Chitinivibrionales bacterium]
MVEELQSGNEELQSSNEELQSTNEELQSSKEEMESLNEELTTVNNELDSKVQALRQAHDDMRNLLNSTDLGVIFLDQQLQVKRYTEKARGLISLRESDIGRPISELAGQVLYENLTTDCREVLDTLMRKETEVQTRDGAWQLMRILPYRTSDNVIGGVVITFVDITRLRQAQVYAQSLGFWQDIVDAINDPLTVLDNDLRVYYVNGAFIKTFRTTHGETEGKKIYDLGNGQWDIPRLRQLLEQVIPQNTIFEDFEVEHKFPAIGHKKFMLSGRRFKRAEGENDMVLMVMRDTKE